MTTIKELLDFINSLQNIQNNNKDFNKLKCFFNAMLRNDYYSISDDEIHRGMEFVKTALKAVAKTEIIPKEQRIIEETNVEAFCKHITNELLSYKHTYENQNNYVI